MGYVTVSPLLLMNETTTINGNNITENMTVIHLTPSHLDDLLHDPRSIVIMTIAYIGFLTILYTFCNIANPAKEKKIQAVRRCGTFDMTKQQQMNRINVNMLKSVDNLDDLNRSLPDFNMQASIPNLSRTSQKNEPTQEAPIINVSSFRSLCLKDMQDIDLELKKHQLVQDGGRQSENLPRNPTEIAKEAPVMVQPRKGRMQKVSPEVEDSDVFKSAEQVSENMSFMLGKGKVQLSQPSAPVQSELKSGVTSDKPEINVNSDGNVIGSSGVKSDSDSSKLRAQRSSGASEAKPGLAAGSGTRSDFKSGITSTGSSAKSGARSEIEKSGAVGKTEKSNLKSSEIETSIGTKSDLKSGGAAHSGIVSGTNASKSGIKSEAGQSGIKSSDPSGKSDA